MQIESRFLAFSRGGAHRRDGGEARLVGRSQVKVIQAQRNRESRHWLAERSVRFAVRIRREGDGARPTQ
jgi:hypothetical protein